MTFAVAPFELAYRRRVLFALELLDPVSLQPVSDGVRVTTTGLVGRPIRNSSGQFVWLEEGATPLRVRVDPQDLPYEFEDRAAPLPPARLLRIVLRPAPGYAVDSGVTAVSGSLYESVASPPTGVSGVDAWLQWIDASGGSGGPWRDASTSSRTAVSGDFIALMRLDEGAIPDLDGAGRLRARLRFDRGGTVRTTPEFPLAQGRTAALASFAWDAL